MMLEEITNNIQTLADRLEPVLESDGSQILLETIAGIRMDKAHYDGYKDRADVNQIPTSWGYEIQPKRPLRFKVANDKGRLLRPDIICNLRWVKVGEPPVARDIILRVWATQTEMICRESWDSEYIQEQVTGGQIKERVMLRCHFDLANEGQTGPGDHMQVGGKPHENEYGWYPKEMDLPRICHYPLDLVLICQLTAANFFPDQYANIKKDLSWKKAVKSMEKHLLSGYFERCSSAVGADARSKTLLDELWNI